MGPGAASLIGGGVSGGQGGIDLSGGPATSGAEGGKAAAGGQTFNFLPPVAAQKAQAVSGSVNTALITVAVIAAVWLYTRNS